MWLSRSRQGTRGLRACQDLPQLNKKLDLTFENYGQAMSTVELKNPSDYANVMQRLANDDVELSRTITALNDTVRTKMVELESKIQTATMVNTSKLDTLDQTFHQSMDAIRGDLATIIRELNRIRAEVDSLQQRVDGKSAGSVIGPMLVPVQPQQGMQPPGYQSLFRQ